MGMGMGQTMNGTNNTASDAIVIAWSIAPVVYSLVCLLSHFSVGQWHAWFTMSCFNCKCANKWQGVKFCDVNLPQKHWQQLLPASQSHGLTHLGGVQGGLHQPAQTPLLPQCDYLWAHSKLLRYPPDVSHQQRARISRHLRLHRSDLPARWHFKVGEEPNKSWHHSMCVCVYSFTREGGHTPSGGAGDPK